MTKTNSILLIVGGGIAAYKSLELIRELSRRGIKSRVILTKAGTEFVTPLSVSGLSGEKCFTDLFNLTDETEMGHIELSRSTDLVVVAPATADLIAKAANGLANDLASTTLLATDKPVLMAPSMNVRMWQHAATQRNLATLQRDGVEIIGPDEGAMACGEFGPGRMAEPIVLADAIMAALGNPALSALPVGDAPDLLGTHVLVTAGPTHESLDPVRYIANRSSGKQGYAIASALAALGAQVTLVSGPTDLANPDGVKLIRVETARQMLSACQVALPTDCFIACAAVSDYRPDIEQTQKIKKDQGGMSSIPLAENPDILKTIANAKKNRPPLVIGFAAETENILANAQRKRATKGCDWIIANDVSQDTEVMGGERNRVIILSDQGEEPWDEMPKSEIARKLATKIAKSLKG